MEKIPISKTIRDAYSYLFANIGIVFGLTWFAALLNTSLNCLFSEPTALFGASRDAVTLASLWLISSVVLVLVYSVAAVVLTRHALGLRSQRTSFYFAFGKAEWRLFLASAECLVATLAGMVASTLGIALLALTGLFPIWLVGGLAIIAILALIAFVSVRYLFFLPLAAVLAPNQWLGRSYDLSAGSSWRILAIVVGVASPVFGCAIVLSLPQLVTELITAWRTGILHWPSSPNDFDAMINSIRRGESHWWYVPRLALEFVGTILLWALVASAAVFAYKPLTR
jgi:hypothetical protein